MEVRKVSCYKIGNGCTVDPWKDPWVPDIVGITPKIKDGAEESQAWRVADLLNPLSLIWDESKLHQLFYQEALEAIRRVKVHGADREDKLFWTRTSNGAFSVKSCYSLLSCNGTHSDRLWKDIWTANLHERLKVFLWRLAADVPLKDTLYERTGKGDPSCTLCGFNKETSSHLFLECPAARAVAFSSKWGLKLDSVATSNSQDLGRWCVCPSTLLSSKLGGKDFTSLLLANFLYAVWELCNDKLFENKSSIA